MVAPTLPKEDLGHRVEDVVEPMTLLGGNSLERSIFQLSG